MSGSADRSVAATGEIRGLFTSGECRNFFRAEGYVLTCRHGRGVGAQQCHQITGFQSRPLLIAVDHRRKRHRVFPPVRVL